MDIASTFTDSCPNVSSAGGNSSYLFLLLLNYLLNSKSSLDLNEDSYHSPNVANTLKDGDQFDFIIIGAGSAGVTTASRLAEANKSWKVLLVEAGGYPSVNSQIPALFPLLQGTEYDWQFRTRPSSTSCLGFKANSCSWPSGKVLGGSSTINAMLYIRGHVNDYNGWAESNPGWTYNDVLPYFLKAERAISDDQQGREHFGQNGPLFISRYHSTSDLRDVLIQSSKELEGRGLGLDKNGYGLDEVPTSIENGIRCSTSKAYLTRPIHKQYQNLFITVNTEAVKLIFNNSLIEGVMLNISGKLVNVITKKEVIVSAGTLNSPKLLMQSGIGPSHVLKTLRIPIAADIPGVGQNLQNHLTTYGVFVELNEMNPKQDIIDDFYQYLKLRKGPLSNMGITNMAWFINSDSNKTREPDTQLLFFEFPKNNHDMINGFSKGIGLNDRTTHSLHESINHNRLLLIVITHLYPLSVGYLEFLKEEDQSIKMEIIPNFFKHDNDVDVLLKGIHFVDKLINTKEFKKLNAAYAKFDTVNCENELHASTEYWKCNLRNFGASLYHPVGTCQMGSNSTHGAVVDHELRLHGVRGVRIVDASIMPKIVGANTNAASIMIGEKAADMIGMAYEVK